MGKGFNTFMRNPFWRRLYEKAPSENMRTFFRMVLDTSPFVMGSHYQDDVAEQQLASLRLDAKDIAYLRDNAGSGQARAIYQRFLDQLNRLPAGTVVRSDALLAEHRNPYLQPTESETDR